jgi:DNA (cytosine-5)-methyltransferase 1
MKIGSLCSGYGGLDLAVETLTGAETVWFSEFNKYAAKVYESHWDLPNIGDLTKVDWTQVEPVDILTGGYPCQPFSTAGKREGQNDKRHIFPYIKEAIRTLQPKLVFLENVRGHLTLGFDSVLEDLAEIGYDCIWTLARASAIGAPHRRERLFIIAFDSSRFGLQTNDTTFNSSQSGQELAKRLVPITDTINNQRSRDWSVQELGSGHNSRSNLSTMQDWGRYTTAIERWEQLTRPVPAPIQNEKLSPAFVEWMMGLPQGWVTDVEISRSQQMQALGNGVVPQQAYAAYKHLLEKL